MGKRQLHSFNIKVRPKFVKRLKSQKWLKNIHKLPCNRRNYCRNVSLLCLLHRITNSKHRSSLPLLKQHRYSRRLQHNLSFQRLYGHTNAFNSSALPRAIVLWNNLPENIANVKETEIFRRLLEKLHLEP